MNKWKLADKLTALAEENRHMKDPVDHGRFIAYEAIRDLVVKELDEPKAPEVVVPQWFADWIERDYGYFTKGEMVYNLWTDYNNDRFTNKQDNWLHDNKKLATRAILDGHTVEQEQLYYVRFAGDCILFQADDEFWVESMENMDSDCTIKHKFTEKEIKAKSERYWQFAVPVEE
ncbi:DUF1642 domain-containing protein [Enterococcus nangangensis]|uniref:DUF1642 domain-containing protein n=1 Tax=Enterococcus nangangensis TaxID=2559926 RepID=UPI0010F61A07|nr:DUF1642 domain-containing protein [Enterococcus nangangensis]